MWTIARLFLLPVLVSLRISPSKRRGATHEKDTRMGFFCGALSSRKKRPGWWIQTTGRFDGVSQKFVFHVFSVLFFWGGRRCPKRIGFSDLIPGDDVLFFCFPTLPSEQKLGGANSNIKALCTMVIDNFRSYLRIGKTCLPFAYLPFHYQFLPIYRAPYSAFLLLVCLKTLPIPMTYTYENLACNIQVPNLEHNLLKTGFLPITAMLLATKVGEMEWFPNEFQVDLLQHKTLC